MLKPIKNIKLTFEDEDHTYTVKLDSIELQMHYNGAEAFTPGDAPLLVAHRAHTPICRIDVNAVGTKGMEAKKKTSSPFPVCVHLDARSPLTAEAMDNFVGRVKKPANPFEDEDEYDEEDEDEEY